MKKEITLSVLTVYLITCSVLAVAQMIPMTTTIKTPYGNIPHTYYVGSPRYYYGQQNISARYEFEVVLKNDSTFKAKTRIKLNNEEDNSIIVKDKGTKQEFFPNDTKYISRVTLGGRVIKGIAADSCWLFKIIKGEINGYSFLSEETDQYVIAIQDGDEGPIVPLTKENLMPLVLSDQKSVALARRNKLRRALTTYNYQVRLKQK